MNNITSCSRGGEEDESSDYTHSICNSSLQPHSITPLSTVAANTSSISTNPEKVKKKSKLRKFCFGFQQFFNLELFFNRWGRWFGRHPGIGIIISVFIWMVTSSGMIFWKQELSDIENFLPKDSIVRKDHSLVRSIFPEYVRYESMIAESDNVLLKENLMALLDLDYEIRSESNGWERVCARYRTWFGKEQDSSGFDEEYLSQLFKNRPEFQGIVRNDCIHNSIFQLWEDKKDTRKKISLENYTQEEIYATVQNALTESYSTYNIAEHLSGITVDENGKLNGAKSIMFIHITDNLKKETLEWELTYLKIVEAKKLPDNLKVVGIAHRSYQDALEQVLKNNLIILFAGCSLIVVYVVVMMGRFNIVQFRIYVALVGLMVVGMAITSSYGVCFFFGFKYGPIHPILPFLLLGVGVDDMFVITSSLDNIQPAMPTLAIFERIGLAMQSSGSSITVTSLTDIVAFGVGITTVMPCLRSFCVFGATGIFFLYLYANTFFISCLALDEERIENQRNAFIPCREVKDFVPNSFSQKSFLQTFFGGPYFNFISNIWISVVIIILGFGLMAMNSGFSFHVSKHFDPMIYLTPGSTPVLYHEAMQRNFPGLGQRAGVYLGEIDYFTERENLFKLYDGLLANPYINKDSVHFWYVDYDKWLNKTAAANPEDFYLPESSEEYYGMITDFLLSKEGRIYNQDIKFNKFPVGDFNITASKISFHHLVLNTTDEQIDAMESLRELIDTIKFPHDMKPVAYAQEYVSWTANKILGGELFKSILLALTVVALVAYGMIRNFWVALSVIICVVGIVLNLIGTMYWYQLTIEISTSINIILCVGLAVDYSAHFGHYFAQLKTGTRKERVRMTLEHMGPPVFNGGGSTFLAFICMCTSDSYIFSTFFKLFLSVVFYGQFYGLCFLPVLLCYIGPEYPSIEEANRAEAARRAEAANRAAENGNVTNDVIELQPMNVNAE